MNNNIFRLSSSKSYITYIAYITARDMLDFLKVARSLLIEWTLEF